MILFDLDGTLTDSNGIWEDVDAKFLGKRGLAVTEEYLHTVGHSIFPTAAQFTKEHFDLPDSPQEIMDEWTDMAREAYRRVALKPGAEAFLARCSANGETMVLLTACQPELCRIALNAHGLERYFSQVIFAQELGLEKRNQTLYHKVFGLLGVTAAACTFYEDAPANCAAAKAVGLNVVGVYDRFYHKYEEELRGVCDRYIMSFEELLDG